MIRRVFRIPSIAAKFVRPMGAFSRSHRFLSQVPEDMDEGEKKVAEAENDSSPTGITPEQANVTEETLVERTVRLSEELELWKKEAARIQADAYNHATRLRKDKKNAEVYAIKRFAKDLLPVVDVLEKAVQIEDQSFEQLFEGVELTLKVVHDVLDKNNLTKIPSKGEKFDPNSHEVVFQTPNEAENGTIIQVIQEGYTLGDHTLRGAKVGISSGPPEDSESSTEA